MTHTQTVLYCHGCNEKFAVTVDERGCPQCGQTLAPLATTYQRLRGGVQGAIGPWWSLEECPQRALHPGH